MPRHPAPGGPTRPRHLPCSCLPCLCDGHPLAVLAEKVSFAAVSKVRWEREKPIICGELDITLHSALPSEVFKVKETLIVEGTLVESHEDSLDVKVDFIVEKTGKVGYIPLALPSILAHRKKKGYKCLRQVN